MDRKYGAQICIVGMAIFSMFFGGGNLTFPLWIGATTSSCTISSLGFLLTGVLLPFYGIIISLYFKGDYRQYLNSCGKICGAMLVFSLLLFWIPLGSGPRCNQLAYGAFSVQTGWNMPFWIYSALYSGVVYFLTVRKMRIIEILGKIITPLLIAALSLLIYSIFTGSPEQIATSTPKAISPWSDFCSSFFAGYHTMDFIAAIFFSSSVIELVKEKEKTKFDFSLIRKACLAAIGLLSAIYIGLITVGHSQAEVLLNIPRDRLLAVIGQNLLASQLQPILFLVITLSVLSTSIALSLVFSDYLRTTLFKEKLDHKACLAFSVLVSFFMSIMGFESLATLISYATAILYPCLLVVTTFALGKSLFRQSDECSKYIENRIN